MDVVGNRGRAKILDYLYQNTLASASELERKLHLNYQWVLAHLKVLVDEGILETQPGYVAIDSEHHVGMTGTPILYKLNVMNPRSLLLTFFISAWNHPDQWRESLRPKKT